MVTNDRQYMAGSIITTFSLADDSSILTVFPIIDRGDLFNPECYEANTQALRWLRSRFRAPQSKLIGTTFSLGSFRYPSELGHEFIGDWSLARRRVFLRSERRLDVYFQVPVFFVCHPYNDKGPIANQIIFHLKRTDESKEYAWISYERITLSRDQSMSWLFLLSTIHKMESTSVAWQR